MLGDGKMQSLGLVRKQASFGAGYSRFMLSLSQMGRIAPQQRALLDGEQSIKM